MSSVTLSFTSSSVARSIDSKENGTKENRIAEIDFVSETLAKMELSQSDSQAIIASPTHHLPHREKKLITQKFITKNPRLYDFLISYFLHAKVTKLTHRLAAPDRTIAAHYFSSIENQGTCRGMSYSFLNANDKTRRGATLSTAKLIDGTLTIFFSSTCTH